MDPSQASSLEAHGATSRWRLTPRLAIALGINLALILFCLWPIITSENFGKPQGKDIPTGLPNEANRVRSQAGYSIAMPANWEARSIYFEDEDWAEVSAYPRSVIPSRFSATMSACRLSRNRPIELKDYRLTEFQGRPAYEAATLRPYADHETPARFYYTLCFERSGRWYELRYAVSQERKTLPPEVWPYFNTFRETDKPP